MVLHSNPYITCYILLLLVATGRLHIPVANLENGSDANQPYQKENAKFSQRNLEKVNQRPVTLIPLRNLKSEVNPSKPQELGVRFLQVQNKPDHPKAQSFRS